MRKKVCVHTPSRYDSGCGCVVCVASKKCVKAQQVGRSLMTHVAFFFPCVEGGGLESSTIP